LTGVGDPGVQQSSRRGLSTFLADHEDCGKGFDIQRREGSDGSIVRVICGGCGKALEYPAVSDEELPVEPALGGVSQRIRSRNRRSPGKPGRTPVPQPEGLPPANSAVLPRDETAAAPEPAPRPSRLFFGWLSIPLIVALIAVGLVLIVVGIASNTGTSDSTLDQPAGPQGAAPLTVPSVPVDTRPARIRLDRRSFAERVSIGIPPGWNAGVEGGAVTIAALNGRSEIQVYFEDGARAEDQLMREARSFLLQRHAGARIAKIGPSAIGKRPVRRVSVIYTGGTESATVLVAGGYSYLILDRLSRPFSTDLRRTTDAVVASFRPT
jgi:hypothetical protein